MKKIILPLIFIGAAFVLQAQDTKPTKEATRKFINSMLAQVVGEKCTGSYLIKKQSFISDFGSYEFTEGDGSGWMSSNITLIKWQELNEFEEYAEPKNVNLRFIRLSFNTKIKNVTDYNCCIVQGSSDFTNDFSFYVSADKYESVKKACYRLSEIAKEENKDPFKN